MKNIIQRNLPLNVRYSLIDKKYIPLSESVGLCCDNCNKLIANIATVKNENKDVFSIGFDCLETLLINNHLLSSSDIQEYEKVKKMIPKVLRFAKTVKEVLHENKSVTGIKFEQPKDFLEDWFTFYWLHGSDKSRDNDNVKIKEMDFVFLIDTLKNIFPNLRIITE